MTEEFKESLEEVFCDRNFILSDEKEDVMKNLEIAKNIYMRAQKEVEELAQCMEDGECWDNTAAILSIQELVFSKKYMVQFEKQLQ